MYYQYYVTYNESLNTTQFDYNKNELIVPYGMNFIKGVFNRDLAILEISKLIPKGFKGDPSKLQFHILQLNF